MPALCICGCKAEAAGGASPSLDILPTRHYSGVKTMKPRLLLAIAALTIAPLVATPLKADKDGYFDKCPLK